MALIKLKDVIKLTTLSRASVYNYMEQGKFPKPVPLGGRVAWILDEVEDWITQRIAERDGC